MSLNTQTPGGEPVAISDADLLDTKTDLGIIDLEDRVTSLEEGGGGDGVPTSRTVNGHPLSADVVVTKADIGLSAVNNTSDLGKPVSTATQTAITAAVDALLDELLNGAPGTLDTLKEIADALGDDPNFATTITNLIAAKVSSTRTVNGHALSADVTVSKADVGLSNVDNVSDILKPLSNAVVAALAAFGTPGAFANRALVNGDNGHNLTCSAARVATVNTGLQTGFGCSFKGIITFAGSATVNDVRTTGAANPWCALLQTDVDVYDCVGGKA